MAFQKRFLSSSLSLALLLPPNGAGSDERQEEREADEITITETREEPFEGDEELVAQEYTIDISDHFIPEILRDSRYAETYLASVAELNEQFGAEVFEEPLDRERFGIYSTFAPHIPLLQESITHYERALERRGEQATPQLSFEESIEANFTTERTLERIAELLAREPRTEREERRLQEYQERVSLVRDIQTILSWESFYDGEINGVYAQTDEAVAAYQRFHHVDDDGVIGSVTRDLLNTPLEEHFEQSSRPLLQAFEERIFHATFVIEPTVLEQVTEEAVAQLGLATPEAVLDFFADGQRPETVTLELHVPERYLQDSMDLRIEIEKSERNRRNTHLELYAQEEESEVLLFSTRAVVGGEYVIRGRRRNFPTPEGDFYLRRVLVFPHWFPPSWAEEEYGDPLTQPGFQNAYGIMAAPFSRRQAIPEEPYTAHYSGDLPYLLHLTSAPESVESGRGRSHGCVRLHPDGGNHLFYFLIRYTPHRPLGRAEYRGEAVPFEQAIPVRIRW